MANCELEQFELTQTPTEVQAALNLVATAEQITNKKSVTSTAVNAYYNANYINSLLSNVETTDATKGYNAVYINTFKDKVDNLLVDSSTTDPTKGYNAPYINETFGLKNKVIYDISDPSIPDYGYPNGIQGSQSINVDMSMCKSLSIAFQMASVTPEHRMQLIKKNDQSVFVISGVSGSNSLFNETYRAIVTVSQAKDILIFNNTGFFNTAGTWNDRNSNTSYIIVAIVGVLI